MADLVADGRGRSEALNFFVAGWTPFGALPVPGGGTAEDSVMVAMIVIPILVLSWVIGFFFSLGSCQRR